MKRNWKNKEFQRPPRGACAAAESNKREITGLGTGTIGKPTKPADKDTAWAGNYVWYGNYEGCPMRYRVLDPHSTKYGGDTMLLDCDSVLYSAVFYDYVNQNKDALYSNEWAYSDVKKGLNEGYDGFLTCSFTDPERAAIADSTVGTHRIKVGSPLNRYFPKYTRLNNDKIFLLDFEDVLNTDYGYSSDCGYDAGWNWHKVESRKKSGSDWGWWLRSPNSHIGDRPGDYAEDYVGGWAGSVDDRGIVHDDSDVRSPSIGVSPAFNVNLSSVIFSSLITFGSGEYKLTLKDEELGIQVTEGENVTRSGNTVTVPYTIGKTLKGDNSDNATQVSVLLLDHAYIPGEKVFDSAKFNYQKLKVNSFSKEGTGTFDLPAAYADKVCGVDYYAYILAEDVNDTYETDYASEPVAITIGKIPV